MNSFAGSSSLAREPSDVDSVFFETPLTFEANRGQFDARVDFVSRGNGYTLFLTAEGSTLLLPPTVVAENGAEANEVPPTLLRMTLQGSHSATRAVGLGRLPGRSHYFVGNDPEGWVNNVPHFERVKYEGVYTGVDLVYRSHEGQLEFDFVVEPSADLTAIRMAYTDSSELRLDLSGNLVIELDAGRVIQRPPVAYQDIQGDRREVPSRYVIDGDKTVRFEVGNYERGHPLIIDPILAYSSYLGGSNADYGIDIAVDDLGMIYVLGSTQSTDFPTDAGPSSFGGGSRDAFVTKLDPAASGADSLVYSAFLGGNGNEPGTFQGGIAVDTSGHVYVTGFTDSTNFPTTDGSLQADRRGNSDGFVTKLNPMGSGLVYSTYLGGRFDDDGVDIAVDDSENAYVIGVTVSDDFPTTATAYQASLMRPGDRQTFVTKINAAGNGILYSTYLGGSLPNLWSSDYGRGIAVDTSGYVYVTGFTGSTDFPTKNAFQSAKQDDFDAFVAKLDPTASGDASLVYSSYLGDNGNDQAYDIDVDDAGNAYVTGVTWSGWFPTTASAFQQWRRGPVNAFLTKIDSTPALAYSTYLGGLWETTFGRGVAVDDQGYVYVTGDTRTRYFPLRNPLMTFKNPLNPDNSADAFVTKFDPSASGDSSLLFSTYLGGCASDQGFDIAVSPGGNAYLTGLTQSSNWPTERAFQPATGGGFWDAMVARIDADGASANLSIDIVDTSDPVTTGQDVEYTVTVQNLGPDVAPDVLARVLLPASVSFVSAIASQGSCNTTCNLSCALGDLSPLNSATVTIVGTTTAAATVTAETIVMSSVSDPSVPLDPLGTPNNNRDRESTTVETLSNQAPVALCRDIDLPLDASGLASLVAGDIDGGSSDPDGDSITLSLDLNSFSCADQGDVLVTLMVDDGQETATCPATVTVRDATAPQLTLAQASIDVAPTSASGATFDVIAASSASAIDACDATPALADDSPAEFPIGVTTVVSITATDSSGNSASQDFAVTVLTMGQLIQRLIDDVQNLNLKQGIENSLDKKLENVQKALAAANNGQPQNAINMLQAFIMEVQAQSGKAIAEADADALIAAAQVIIALLGT